MKLSELKTIMHLLPDDTEITISNAPVSTAPLETLKREDWGNHDGRYNMRCTICNWVSDDIRRDGTPPIVCPQCKGHGFKQA